MPMDVVDHEINGAEMQFVAVELGGGGLFGKLLGAGKRLVTGESLFTTV